MRLNKKAIIVATCAACTLGLAAGCAPQQSENAGAAAPSGDGGAVPQEQKLTPEQQAVIDGAEGTTNEDIDEKGNFKKLDQKLTMPKVEDLVKDPGTLLNEGLKIFDNLNKDKKKTPK